MCRRGCIIGKFPKAVQQVSDMNELLVDLLSQDVSEPENVEYILLYSTLGYELNSYSLSDDIEATALRVNEALKPFDNRKSELVDLAIKSANIQDGFVDDSIKGVELKVYPKNEFSVLASHCKELAEPIYEAGYGVMNHADNHNWYVVLYLHLDVS